MAFTWKSHDAIWKGEGVYFLTWVVNGRQRLLGELEPATGSNSEDRLAWVRATDLGRAVLRKFEELEGRFPQLQILAKELMPDHFHAVVWMHEGFDGSIKMVARGFAQGCSKIAREIAMAKRGALLGAQLDCAKYMNAPSLTENAKYMNAPCPIGEYVDAPSLTENAKYMNAPCSTGEYVDAASLPGEIMATGAVDPYDCGNGAHTLFDTPFIRTLSHKGQLRSMIDYVHTNPDNAWMRRLHPELYTIRRNVQHDALAFDAMGKSRLLDYPDRQVIALSRTLSDERIAEEVERALWHAGRGVVTLTAAINRGEKAVAHAVRSAGYPLVVMMLNGFPPEGTEMARYFHPSGAYHQACGEGRLYLLAPSEMNYANPRVVAATDAELKRKAEQKHWSYTPLPHTSTRWRMIAGNVMLRMIAGEKV